MSEHYSAAYRHWLLAKWKNLPEEVAQMMHQAGCAIESLELDNAELLDEVRKLQRKELTTWRARGQDASDRSQSRSGM
jgi:hypothetical protein